MLHEDHLNPFQTDLRLELPQKPVDQKNWTEYWFFFTYDLKKQTGMCVHIGRDIEDTSIFGASISVFLPGGEMLAAQFRGRDGHSRGPGAGPLRLTCIDPGRLWTAEFDGLMHRTTRSQLMRAPLQDSTTERVQFSLGLEGMSPIWDLALAGIAPNLELVKEDRDTIPGEKRKMNHWEQIGRARGEIIVAGEVIPIDGFGIRDHSFGPRDYSHLTGSHWFASVFPSGKVFMLMATRAGDNFIRGGYLYKGDGTPIEVLRTIVEHPLVTDPDTPDGALHADPLKDEYMRAFRLRFLTSEGEVIVDGETLHGVPTTQVAPAYEILGTDLARGEGALQMCDCPVRYRWGDEEAAGIIERITPIRKLRGD